MEETQNQQNLIQYQQHKPKISNQENAKIPLKKYENSKETNPFGAPYKKEDAKSLREVQHSLYHSNLNALADFEGKKFQCFFFC